MFLLVEQDVLNSLSKHSLTQSVINVSELILNLLLSNLLRRLKLRLYHAYNLCDFAIQQILLYTPYHATMCKHDDSEAHNLSDLCPHVRSAYDLPNQEEKEELCHLSVKELREREVGKGLEMNDGPEHCKK